jgi:hypothetical protein
VATAVCGAAGRAAGHPPPGGTVRAGRAPDEAGPTGPRAGGALRAGRRPVGVGGRRSARAGGRRFGTDPRRTGGTGRSRVAPGRHLPATHRTGTAGGDPARSGPGWWGPPGHVRLPSSHSIRVMVSPTPSGRSSPALVQSRNLRRKETFMAAFP